MAKGDQVRPRATKYGQGGLSMAKCSQVELMRSCYAFLGTYAKKLCILGFGRF